MKKVSITTKIMLVIAPALMLMTGIFTFTLFQQVDDQLDDSLRQKSQSIKSQYDELLKQEIRKVEIWVNASKNLLDYFEQAVTQSLIDDYIEMGVEDVEYLWVVDESGQSILANRDDIPLKVKAVAAKSQSDLTPGQSLYCEELCYNMVAVPIYSNEGQVLSVVVATRFTDMLISLSRSFRTDLALVELYPGRPHRISKVIINSNKEAVERIIAASEQLKVDVPISEVEQGMKITLEGVSYWMTVKPLPEDNHFLLIYDDITRHTAAKTNNQQAIVVSALVLFVLFFIAMYFITKKVNTGIRTLAKSLPLLADKKYQEFRQTELLPLARESQELEQLTAAALDLSKSLEELEKKNETSKRELERISMYDSVTFLPNRNMLNFQLEKSIAALAGQESMVGMLFIGIDNFGKVNESLGYRSGDQLLKDIARRLTYNLPKNDVLCRFGADEFALVVPRVRDAVVLSGYFDIITTAFKQSFNVQGTSIDVSASIGGECTDDEEVTAEEFIKRANIAMQAAKAAGGNNGVMFSQSMLDDAAKRAQILSEFKRAMDEGHFSLDLQPKMSVKDGKLHSFEALMRWHHPDLGFIPPNDFIPILENSRYMKTLGYWLIEDAARILDNLKHNGYPALSLAINVSASQFLDDALFDVLTSELAKYGLEAHLLELELTERSLVQDVEYTVETMAKLRQAGFKISVDDYGTGYSSLSYLKQMPIDCLKIDRGFISGMLDNKADMEIVTSTIKMAHNLGMYIVAEGIENRAELDLINGFDGEYAQGYLISKPIPEKQLLPTLKKLFPDLTWRDHLD